MLRGFALLSRLVTRIDPTAPMRPVNASWIPRVILAQSSRAAIFLSHRKPVLRWIGLSLSKRAPASV
jgi:hypothetical protein